MTVEDVVLWLIYVGALQAQKQRKFAHITAKNSWRSHLMLVRVQLEVRGLRL